MKIKTWYIIPILLFLSVLVFLGRGLLLDPHQLPSAQIGKTIPNFNLPGLSATELRGKVLLLNVWASWCEACAAEQAFLMSLKETGIPIYGLNYKDKPADALTWLRTWGNPYQKIGYDANGFVGIDLGVYGTPETFLIDADGKILRRYAGILTKKIWLQEFAPCLK